MRIGSEYAKSRGMADHALCDVGMKIQTDNDRQGSARQFANPGEQFALAILMRFGHHRSVQVKVNPVESAGLFDPVQNHH